MVPGSVGFQCPECVSQGMRQTRQRELPYGGSRPARPTLTSIVLIAMNALVFVAVMVTGGAFETVFNSLALKPEGFCMMPDGRLLLTNEIGCLNEGLTWVDGVATGSWWQIITSAFTHADPMHIAFNMLALWFLGPQLEQIFGRARFLAIYLVSALTASAVIMWFSTPWLSTIGASGAVFGLMAAVLLVAHKHSGNVRTILMWLGANVVITIVGSAYISWQGHLGGFIGGLLVTAALMYLPKARRKTLQWPLVALVAVLAVVAIVVRALALG